MNIEKFKVIFWDFDGVIKDSIEAKGEAFVELFKTYGEVVCNKILDHHLCNLGMSRYIKMPIYLELAGEEISEKKVNSLCEALSQLIKIKVINSPWVPGVQLYLDSNWRKQKFFIVTATPQKEIEIILEDLDISRKFASIFGYPINKTEAIRKTLIEINASKSECLMIGDAKVDHDAALDTGITFLLRRHTLNERGFSGYGKDFINDFNQVG